MVRRKKEDRDKKDKKAPSKDSSAGHEQQSPPAEQSETKEDRLKEKAENQAKETKKPKAQEKKTGELLEKAEESAESKERPEKDRFHIVGIGASAGGLEAFEQFFSNMPQDTGMAFVLVPHLDPTHVSILSDLIQKHTEMQVAQVDDGMKVLPNHVYIIPPNKDLAILHGVLQLIDTNIDGGLRMPIDYFFRSLAEDQGEWAVGVVLSGMGTDGTLGLKAIKGELGMVMVQDPESSRYSSMPKSAIDNGLADYVLSPDLMAMHLIEYTQRVKKQPRPKIVSEGGPTPDALQKIFILIRSVTGHDFSQYKQNTILRRIARRMTVHRIENLAQYMRYLQQNKHEVHILFKELLIGVTSFFRDPDAFDALKKQALLPLIRKNPDNCVFRVWVPGCSSGEEAYSIAILVRECMDELDKHIDVQIFASDIDGDAVEAARQGSYPLSISTDMSRERLEAFFYREDSVYRIGKDIREMVVFAPQNMIKDPPFTKLDLISCRNLLIYLDVPLQKKLLPLFHYALKPDGILFLGSSESIGSYVDIFATLDKRWKIFRRRETAAPPSLLAFPGEPRAQEYQRAHAKKNETVGLARLAEHILLNDYAPPSVLINNKGEILYVHGRTGKYLEPAPGEARMNILDMVRKGLEAEIPSGIRRASSQKKDVTYNNVVVKTNGGFQNIDLTIRYISEPDSMRGLMLVVFQDTPDPEQTGNVEKVEPTDISSRRVRQLEKELKFSKEDLQTTIEELETSNEELKSTNEELQSTNEELQSANEELETSKEEQQSLNEELATVNAELQGKIDELSNTYSDVKNLLDAVNVPTIFVDSDLNIKRFTTQAKKLVNLIASDVGRPIEHIVPNLRYDNMAEDARAVLRTLAAREVEVQAKDGQWYLMRLIPFRTTENIISGVVITFLDINQQKKALEELDALKEEVQEAREYAENIVETVREPLLVLDKELRVVSANHSFYDVFHVTPDRTTGDFIYDLGNQQWDIPQLRVLLEEVLPRNNSFEDFEVEHDFPKIGKRKMILNARKIEQQTSERELILLAIEDVTDKK